MISMELLGVRMELMGNVPVLLLREREGLRRVLPIYVGVPEATSIQWAAEGREAPRPLTHDLIVDLLGAFGAVLEKVLITDVQEGTFFAELHLQSRTGPIVVSSRPSDAIAIAVRAGAMIYCTGDVLDEAGRIAEIEEETSEVSGADEATETELLGEFRDFIENIRPEDFGT
jgi:bifunctional DNase/RNase